MVVEDAPPLVEDLTLFGGCGALLSLPLLLHHQANKSGFISNINSCQQVPREVGGQLEGLVANGKKDVQVERCFGL